MVQGLFAVTLPVSVESSVHNGIAQFSLLSKESCSELVSQLQCIEKSPKQHANILHEDAILLNGTSVGDQCSAFVGEVLSPLAHQLFPQESFYALEEKDFLAFAIRFRASTHSMGGMTNHIDESIITFNICIGSEFTGGNLEFATGLQTTIVDQRVGNCVAHLGSVPHKSEDTISGERINIIFWCYPKMPNRSRFEYSPKFYDMYTQYLGHITSPESKKSVGFDVPSLRQFIARQTRIGEAKKDMLANLPMPLQAKILQWIEPEDFMESLCVCQSWKNLLLEQKLYLSLYVDRFGRLAEETVNFKELYQKSVSNSLRPKRCTLPESGEVITIHVGGTGIGVGEKMWELFCLEHEFESNGEMNKIVRAENQGFRPFFAERRDRVYTPRALFVDFDPSSTSHMKRGYKELFTNNSFVVPSGFSSAQTFARAERDGGPMLNLSMDRIRKMAEDCDKLQGFKFIFNTGGGTGSCLSQRLGERIRENYSVKNILMAHAVYPSFEAVGQSDRERAHIRVIACVALATLLIGNAYYLGSEEVKAKTSTLPHATYPPHSLNDKIPPNNQIQPDATLPPPFYTSQETIPPFLSASNDENMLPKEDKLPIDLLLPISGSSDLPPNLSIDNLQDSVSPGKSNFPPEPIPYSPPSSPPSSLPLSSSSSLLYSHCKGMENGGSAHCLLQNVCLINKTLYINAEYNSSLYPSLDSYVVPQSRDIGNRYSLEYLPNHNVTSAPSFVPGLTILFWNVNTFHWGHFLVQNLYGWVQLLALFNLTSSPDLIGQYNVFTLVDIIPSYMELFTKKPINSTFLYDSFLNGNTTICFENVLVGSDKLSLISGKDGTIYDIHPTAQDVPVNGGQIFRDYMTKYLNLSEEKEQREPIKIYIIRRISDMRTWHKHDEVVPKLTAALTNLFSRSEIEGKVPDWKILEVDFALMSPMDQVKFVRNSIDVLVGISGTGLHNAMFLAPKKAVIEVVPTFHWFVNYPLCAHDDQMYCQAFEASVIFDTNTQEYGAWNGTKFGTYDVELVVDIGVLAKHVLRSILYVSGLYSPPSNVIAGFTKPT